MATKLAYEIRYGNLPLQNALSQDLHHIRFIIKEQLQTCKIFLVRKMPIKLAY